MKNVIKFLGLVLLVVVSINYILPSQDIDDSRADDAPLFKSESLEKVVVTELSEVKQAEVNIENKKSAVNSLLPTIIYDNGLLGVKVADYPLSLLLEEIGRKTNLVFHPEQSTLSHLVNIDLEPLALESALKLILKNHNYAFLYKKEKLFSIGVYSSIPGESFYSDVLSHDKNSISQNESSFSADSAESIQKAMLNASASQAKDFIQQGMQSDNEDARAISLWFAEQKNISLQSGQLNEIINNDSSILVRSIALLQFLNKKDVADDLKTSLAIELSNEADSHISRQARDYLDNLNGETTKDHSASQLNTP